MTGLNWWRSLRLTTTFSSSFSRLLSFSRPFLVKNFFSASANAALNTDPGKRHASMRIARFTYSL